MSDEDFDAVYHALEMVNTPFDEEDAGLVLKAEREAWRVLQRVRAEQQPQT